MEVGQSSRVAGGGIPIECNPIGEFISFKIRALGSCPAPTSCLRIDFRGRTSRPARRSRTFPRRRRSRKHTARVKSRQLTPTRPPAAPAASTTAKQIDKMGITDQMKGKTKHPPAGGFSGSLLVNGQADIAIDSKARAAVGSRCRSGRTAAGRHGLTVTYDAGVQTGAAQADAAKTLVKYLIRRRRRRCSKRRVSDPA